MPMVGGSEPLAECEQDHRGRRGIWSSLEHCEYCGEVESELLDQLPQLPRLLCYDCVAVIAVVTILRSMLVDVWSMSVTWGVARNWPIFVGGFGTAHR